MTHIETLVMNEVRKALEILQNQGVGYIDLEQTGVIDDFAEQFIYKAVCEGCSGCCGCYEESRQSECEDWKSYMEIVEQLKGEKQ